MNQDTKNKFAEILKAAQDKANIQKVFPEVEEKDKVKMESFTIVWHEGSGKYDNNIYDTWNSANKAMTAIYNEHSGLGYLKVKIYVKWVNGKEFTDRADCSDNPGDFCPNRETIGDYLKKQTSVMYAGNLNQGDRKELSFKDTYLTSDDLTKVDVQTFVNSVNFINDVEINQELSNTTIDDLLNEYPVSVSPVFNIIDYSEKGFAIVIPNYEQLTKEDAKLVIEKLHYTGGKYNKYLKCGKGWIFSKKKAYTVRKALNLI